MKKKSENLKIKDGGRVPSFLWLRLPWKPIRHHVVSINRKYKNSSLYVPNIKSTGERCQKWTVCMPSRVNLHEFDSCNLVLLIAPDLRKMIQKSTSTLHTIS